MLTAEEIDARRHAARKREIVERILPGVERMLDETDGYVNISVDEILRSSGLSRSTFYRYFKDKNDLLIALSEPALEAILQAAMHPWELGPDATPDRLETLMLETMDAYAPHQPLLDALVEASAYDPAVRERFRGGFDHVREALTARLEEGQAAGFIRPGLPARATAGWLTWMAERGMSQLVPSTDAAERAELARGIAAIMWHTVYADRD